MVSSLSFIFTKLVLAKLFRLMDEFNDIDIEIAHMCQHKRVTRLQLEKRAENRPSQFQNDRAKGTPSFYQVHFRTLLKVKRFHHIK